MADIERNLIERLAVTTIADVHGIAKLISGFISDKGGL